MPYAPSWIVVPTTEPPIGTGTLPLCAFRYLVLRGASWDLKRTDIELNGCTGLLLGEANCPADAKLGRAPEAAVRPHAQRKAAIIRVIDSMVYER